MANNHNQMCRELYHWYRERGFCVRCGRMYAEPGHATCKACYEKYKAAEQVRDPDKSKQRQRMKDIYLARKAAGQCTRCGRKLKDGDTHCMCEMCRANQAEISRLYIIRKKLKEGRL